LSEQVMAGDEAAVCLSRGAIYFCFRADQGVIKVDALDVKK